VIWLRVISLFRVSVIVTDMVTHRDSQTASSEYASVRDRKITSLNAELRDYDTITNGSLRLVASAVRRPKIVESLFEYLHS